MKTRKKRKFKKRYWLLIDLAAAMVIFILLLYKPARYDPPQVVYDRQVGPYLTHVLLPRLYNGAQRQEPFNLVVTQQRINDTIARSKWPKRSGGVSFSVPVALFVTDQIILMTAVNIKGIEFVVTIVVEPGLDQQGLLNLWVAKVKVGAMNITPLARVAARRMYRRRLATTDIDTEGLGAKIAGSLLNNEPFDPVFPVEDKKVRAKKITVQEAKLIVRLVPVSG